MGLWRVEERRADVEVRKRWFMEGHDDDVDGSSAQGDDELGAAVSRGSQTTRLRICQVRMS